MADRIDGSKVYVDGVLAGELAGVEPPGCVVVPISITLSITGNRDGGGRAIGQWFAPSAGDMALAPGEVAVLPTLTIEVA